MNQDGSQITDNGSIDSGPMQSVKDLAYIQRPGSEAKLTSLDVYYKQWPEKRPVIIMVHGGAWAAGDKGRDAVAETKSQYFTSQGYVFVSINYRLAPAVVHPAQVEDVAAAIAWVNQHIAEYQGDPARIYVMGHSAGAQLAALVATDERYLGAYGLQPAGIKGVICLDGAGYDIPSALKGYQETPQKAYLLAFTEDPAVQADASAVNHIATGKALPPFLIIYVNDREAARKQSSLLAEKLQSTGHSATLYPAGNVTHRTINTGIGAEGDAVTAAIMKFILSV